MGLPGSAAPSYPDDYWPCVGDLSIVNAIGAQLYDSSNLEIIPMKDGSSDEKRSGKREEGLKTP